MQRCPHPRVRGAGFIAARGAGCEAQRTVGVSREQVGTALRRLAQDLIAERRRVAVLERENRELRAELERLERVRRDQQGPGMDPPAAA
jgi:hypothetical protein